MSKSQEISRSRQQVSEDLKPSPKERLKRAKYEHKERMNLAKLRNKRYDRTCSLVEVIVIVGAIIVLALLLRDSKPESLKSTIALIGSIVTITSTILIAIRMYRRRKRSDGRESTLPKF